MDSWLVVDLMTHPSLETNFKAIQLNLYTIGNKGGTHKTTYKHEYVGVPQLKIDRVRSPWDLA
jgi:hypothetical protein